MQLPPLRLPVAGRQTHHQQINKAHRDLSIHHVHSTEYHMPTTPHHCRDAWCIHKPPSVQENKRSLPQHISRLSSAYYHVMHILHHARMRILIAYLYKCCNRLQLHHIPSFNDIHFIRFANINGTNPRSEMSLPNGINIWNTTFYHWTLNQPLPPLLAHTAAADEPSTIPAWAKPVLLFFIARSWNIPIFRSSLWCLWLHI